MSMLLPTHDQAIGRQRRRRLIFALGVLLLLGAAFAPAKGLWRKAHARKLVSEAEAYAAQNRPDAALASVTAAAIKGETGVRALRLLLDLNGRAGKEDAVRAWVGLSRAPELPIEDRRELLRWAVRWGQAEWADAQWLELSKEQPISPESARVAATYFEFRGEPRAAVEMARLAMEKDKEGTDLETRTLLGRVLLKHGSPRDQAIGKRLLMETAERSDAVGLAVLRQLAESRALLPFEAQQCLSWLERNPAREKRDELAAADLRMQVTPYRRGQIVAEMAASEVEPATLGRWLLDRQAHKELLGAIPPEKAAASKELALLRLDGLAQAERWAEVEAELEAGRLPAPPLETALYRARAATALNRPRIAELQWKQAEQHAGKDPRSLLLMAGYAAGAKAWTVAEAALRNLAAQPEYARRAWEQLLRMAWAANSATKAREVLAEMGRIYPEDLAIQNDLAYVDLLLQREVPEAFGRAESLHRRHPERWAFRATLALGMLRMGRERDALRLLEAENLDWQDAPAGHRAIYAAALWSAGQKAKAMEIRRSIRAEEIRPEEDRLIESVVAL